MPLVKMIAIEPCDQHRPGELFEASERVAVQLEAKGLAKRAVAHANKMAPIPANKANPSQAAGEAAQSSASPAAPASPCKTAAPSKRGATAPRKRAASSR